MFRSTVWRKNLRPASRTALARSIFRTLPGVWSLRRETEDARPGAGSLTGTVVFIAQPGGALRYEEQGYLTLGAWRGRAFRRWIYALEGDALSVRYPDTWAELHCFVFAAEPSGETGAQHIHAQHIHICGEDRYDARLELRPDGSLLFAYQVTGPAKDYRLHTLLTRA